MKTLQSRILAFFLVLLLIVVSVTLLAVYRAAYFHTRGQVVTGLDQGSRIIEDKLASRSRTLASAAETLAKDDALRQAIFAEAEDHESLLVALDNHRLRTEADLALLLQLDGSTLAFTADPELEEVELPTSGLTASRPESRSRSRIVVAEDHILQLVLVPYYVPVSAPEPSLWLVLGQTIDDEFAREVKELTGLDAAFVDPGREDLDILASSLGPRTRRALAVRALPGEEAVETLELAGTEFLLTSANLSEASVSPLIAVLLRSVREAFLDFRRLAAQILAITLVSIGLVVVGALLISRGITRPLRSLGEAAREIAGGDYEAELPEESVGEVGDLARELGTMQREIRNRERAIEHLAYHDDLTGLPNRNRFRTELDRAIRRAAEKRHRLAVAVIDLDRFKEINDTLGHHVGDRLLLEVGSRLEALEAESGGAVRVARLGGDEFGALFPGVGIEEARSKAEEIRTRLGEPMETDEILLETQASIGLAAFPDHGGDPGSLLRQAEVAMYVAKERWLGIAFYESSEDQHSIHRLSLMSDLRRAVENDGLDLVYQAKLEIATTRIRQVEALVRWDHPRLGPVSPAEFVPIAEQTGTVRHLSRWVLRRAVKQIVAWREQGLTLQVAVNMSALDLHDRDLPGWLAVLLEESSLSAGSLVLEVTEGSVMADPGTARGILDELASMGATISIDDFGTGYSSLTQLQRLPVHELKVDRSFVKEMTRSDQAHLIVRSTVELGHSLGLRVVAEGVETREDLALLRELGCDLAQGYFIGEPQSPDALARELLVRAETGSDVG